MLLHLIYLLLWKNCKVYLILVKISPGNHTCWSVRYPVIIVTWLEIKPWCMPATFNTAYMPGQSKLSISFFFRRLNIIGSFYYCRCLLSVTESFYLHLRKCLIGRWYTAGVWWEHTRVCRAIRSRTDWLLATFATTHRYTHRSVSWAVWHSHSGTSVQTVSSGNIAFYWSVGLGLLYVFVKCECKLFFLQSAEPYLISVY